MTDKIALICGANKGIGLETARQLGKQGVTVIIGSRDEPRGRTAADELRAEGIKAESVVLDVTDEASINRAAEFVKRTFGRLDILVNNAGIMKDAFDKAPSEQSLDMWRRTFDTNLFGVVAVTKAFLPLLRKSEAGRIVNVSSILGSMAANVDPQSTFYGFKIPAYNISKTALNAWTVHLAYELRDTNIKVNSAHPGFVKTELHNVDAPLTPAEGAKTSVRLALLPADGPTGSFFNGQDVQPW
jgi:NAD(P)-dependent dehydrogenase (short-subunit alcohol dehydrogenase family)